MIITNRVRKLERSEAFAGPASLVAQAFQLAEKAAMRIAGVPLKLAYKDSAAREAIHAELQESFLKRLNRAELSSLQEELRQRRALLATGTVR